VKALFQVPKAEIIEKIRAKRKRNKIGKA